MKRVGAVLSLMVALFLLGSAFWGAKTDLDNTRENMNREFAEMKDEFALNADFQASAARKQSEEIEAIAGAAFLIGGLVLFKK